MHTWANTCMYVWTQWFPCVYVQISANMPPRLCAQYQILWTQLCLPCFWCSQCNGYNPRRNVRWADILCLHLYCSHLCAPPAWMSWLRLVYPHCCAYAAHSTTWCVQGLAWLWPWTPKPCVKWLWINCSGIYWACRVNFCALPGSTSMSWHCLASLLQFPCCLCQSMFCSRSPSKPGAMHALQLIIDAYFLLKIFESSWYHGAPCKMDAHFRSWWYVKGSICILDQIVLISSVIFSLLSLWKLAMIFYN